MKLYAIIDAGNAPELFQQLEQYQPIHSCLYNHPVQESLLPFAPFLVQLTSDEFKEWLIHLETPWGIYLTSYADFNTLRNHLRRHTYMQIPISKKPVISRYYDPRVIWEFTHILSDEKLHCFLGPIEIVATFYEGYYLQDHFGPRRKNFPKGMQRNTLFLELTADEYQALNQFSEERYIIELRDHMLAYVDPEIIERQKNHPDRIHQEMLQHERDIKGAPITHAADHQFLFDQQTQTTDHLTSQDAYFEFLPQSNRWYLNHLGHRLLIQDSLLNGLLIYMGTPILPISQFHERTGEAHTTLVEQLMEDCQPADANYRSDLADQKEPYFYHQFNQWYFIDADDYAYPINVGDPRLHVLIALAAQGVEQMSDQQFHTFTQKKYQHLQGLPYPPIKKDKDEPYVPKSWEEMKEALYQLAREFYYFCDENEITDDRSIKGLGKMLVLKEIFLFQNIPESWLTSLTNTNYEGFFNAESLMLDQIGYVPA